MVDIPGVGGASEVPSSEPDGSKPVPEKLQKGASEGRVFKQQDASEALPVAPVADTKAAALDASVEHLVDEKGGKVDTRAQAVFQQGLSELPFSGLEDAEFSEEAKALSVAVPESLSESEAKELDEAAEKLLADYTSAEGKQLWTGKGGLEPDKFVAMFKSAAKAKFTGFKTFQQGNYQVRASWQDGKLELIRQNSAERPLGVGTFGLAFGAINISSSGTRMALKIPHTEATIRQRLLSRQLKKGETLDTVGEEILVERLGGEDALAGRAAGLAKAGRADVLREIKARRRLSSELEKRPPAERVGLQGGVHAVINLHGGSSDSPEIGHLSTRYNTDAMSWTTAVGMTFDQDNGVEYSLKMFDQMLMGLKNLSDYVHLDIKAANMMVLETKDGPRVDIADLAGIKKQEDFDKTKLTLSAQSVYYKDFEALSLAQPRSKEIFDIGKRIDVRSMGMALLSLFFEGEIEICESMDDKPGYFLDASRPMTFPGPTGSDQELGLGEYLEEMMELSYTDAMSEEMWFPPKVLSGLKDLILSMIDPDDSAVPTAEEVHAQFRNLLPQGMGEKFDQSYQARYQ